MSRVLDEINDAPYKVLYDADCEICCNAMSKLKRLDKIGVTEGVPLSEQVIAQLKIPATFEECSAEMHMVSNSGQLYVGYFAILKLASLFPSTKLLAGIAKRIIPASWGCAWYRKLARNRYKIRTCATGKCGMHNQ